MPSRVLIAVLSCVSAVALGDPEAAKVSKEEPKMVGGFRMEGSARVTEVFGAMPLTDERFGVAIWEPR